MSSAPTPPPHETAAHRATTSGEHTVEHSVQHTVEHTTAAVTAWFHTRITRLQSLADALVTHLRTDEQGHIDLSDATRRKLKNVSAKYLAENPVVDGCGLIFAHSALGTPNGHLEWWVREDESRFARYSFGVVPGADRYYDYEQHEWFVRAYHDGTPALVGPYIDYLGVEVYVVTLTVPAVAAGSRVGAVGNDIQAIDLEREILPLLQRCNRELVLVGRHDTVLCSNSSRFYPGEHLENAATRFARTSLIPGTDDAQLLVPLSEKRNQLRS